MNIKAQLENLAARLTNLAKTIDKLNDIEERLSRLDDTMQTLRADICDAQEEASDIWMNMNEAMCDVNADE